MTEQILHKNKGLGGYSEIWRIAYPLILMNAAHTINQFIDRKFLSMYSTDLVAAAAPAGILCFTLFSFFVITTNFTSAIISQAHGREDSEACYKALWTGALFALIAGLVSSYLTIHLGTFLIDIANHPPAIMELEKNYFVTLFPGAGFICLSSAFCSYFSGQGKTWYVTGVQFIACIVNIILDKIFIFGYGPIPAMGITGAGIATTLATVFSAFLAFCLFWWKTRKSTPFSFIKKVDFTDLKRLLLFGAPCGIQVAFEVGSFTWTIFCVGALGTEAMTATTIALSINMISFMPLMGISDAVSIVVGRYIGKKDLVTAEKVAFNAWRMASAYMIFMAVIFVVFPDFLLNFFAPEVETIDFTLVVNIGRSVLCCAAVFNFFDATFFIFNGALRGAGDTKFNMWVQSLTGWLILAPGTWIIVNKLQGTVTHVWIFLAGYVFVISCISFGRFKSGVWKTTDIVNFEK